MNELEANVARELLTRSGMSVIWQAHVAADAAYRAGNDRAANILLDIADAAEAIWLAERSYRGLPAMPLSTSGLERNDREWITGPRNYRPKTSGSRRSLPST